MVNSITIDQYIISCDVGTTKLKCMIYDHQAEIKSLVEKEIELLHPQPGHTELDPNDIWEKFIHGIRQAIADAGLHVSQISCLGLSTLRGTFVLWDKSSGKPIHNFITWKDLRADPLVQEWNKSWTMKLVRLGSGTLYNLTRKKRYLAASLIQFQNVQVNMRLKWILEHNNAVKEALKKGNLLFGTVDTWLVYKLTGGKVHATDHSNASGTAIYDPYLMKWSTFLCKLIRLPHSIFPEVRDTTGYWGETVSELFGAPIPITSVVSDQGAAMFGSCSFNQGDVKITLGTGAFFDVHTGKKPHTSISGIYPVVGWKSKEGIVYMAEGSTNDNGTIIEWGKKMGFYNDYSEISQMAASVQNTNGVYFIPGFQGLQAPINDAQATGGFIGLTSNTQTEHLVRAMLESLAFRVYQIYLVMKQEANYEFKNVGIDGGVAQNDFMMQIISTLSGKCLERPKSIESSSLGCCFLAGIGAGIWECGEDVASLRVIEKTFEPEPENRDALLLQMRQWEKALNRFTKWYPNEGSRDNKSSWESCLDLNATMQGDQHHDRNQMNKDVFPSTGLKKLENCHRSNFGILSFCLHLLFKFLNNFPAMYTLGLIMCVISYFYFGWL